MAGGSYATGGQGRAARADPVAQGRWYEPAVAVCTGQGGYGAGGQAGRDEDGKRRRNVQARQPHRADRVHWPRAAAPPGNGGQEAGGHGAAGRELGGASMMRRQAVFVVLDAGCWRRGGVVAVLCVCLFVCSVICRPRVVIEAGLARRYTSWSSRRVWMVVRVKCST